MVNYEKPLSFLDMVRLLGEQSRDQCDPGCSVRIHEREAAQALALILDSPSLLHGLASSPLARREPTAGQLGLVVPDFGDDAARWLPGSW